MTCETEALTSSVGHSGGEGGGHGYQIIKKKYGKEVHMGGASRENCIATGVSVYFWVSFLPCRLLTVDLPALSVYRRGLGVVLPSSFIHPPTHIGLGLPTHAQTDTCPHPVVISTLRCAWLDGRSAGSRCAYLLAHQAQ